MKLIWTSFTVLMVSIIVFAGVVPQQIGYQGYLTRNDGSPLDTVVTMSFGLYQHSTGGSSVWTQVQNACTVRTGMFAVALGPIEVQDTSFHPDTLWLGVAVGNNSEMVPRAQFLSVPFALMVGSLDGAEGGHVRGPVYIDNTLWTDTIRCMRGIRFSDNSWQNSAWDTSSLSYRINGKADSAGNATRAWVLAQGYTAGGGQAYADTNMWDATQSWTNARLALKQAYADTNTWDATQTWVRSMGYLKGPNNVVNSVGGFVGGGDYNKARGTYSVIAGGGTGSAADSNSVTGSGSTIGGGIRNSVTQFWSGIGGGQHNQIDGSNSVIAGGAGNVVTNSQSTIGGGASNTVSGNCATIAGGSNNRARGNYSTVCGGGGSIAIDSNAAIGVCSFVGGGQINTASGDFSTVGGGRTNFAAGDGATVGGGDGNSASDDDATISGGYANLASGFMATVGGGARNHARGWYSTVAGGGGGAGDPDTNCASGSYSMIPGGRQNWANGNYSFAAGRRARAIHDGSFVWADTTDANFNSAVNNSFSVRASGGYRLYSNSALTAGVTMAVGASGWTNVSDSTLKRNRRNVDSKAILEKVTALPIQQWSYEAQDPSVEHVGPMAQDFWKQFHLGDDSLGINQIDPDGIALAAIQELAKRCDALEKQNRELQTQVQSLMAGDKKTIEEEQ